VSDDTGSGLGGELGRLEAEAEHEVTRIERDVSAELGPAWRRLTDGEERWPAALGVLVMVVLQLRLPSALTPSSHGVGPWVELVLLVLLVAVNPRRIKRRPRGIRVLSLTLIGVATLINGWSVIALIDQLLAGGADTGDAATLLGVGANIWVTNVIVFALWYWEFDRGGPGARAEGSDPEPDFLFPQMATPELGMTSWEPEFLDYLYVSFTNATAFSPTDTMPLSRWTKVAMLVQSAVSLVTAALVIARAVNILH
jgi:uncharacterized membrane protein